MEDQHYWHESYEQIFAELCDEAQIRGFLHKKSYEYYYKKNLWFQVPIMMFSAISGSGNFISNSFPDYQKYMILAIGGLSILTGMLSSIFQYLKVSELSEAHRLSYLSWEKFYTNIRFQLRRKDDDRDNIIDFVNMIIPEYQRLIEISPDIPTHISNIIKRRKKELNWIHLPFILSDFDKTMPFGSNSNNNNLANLQNIIIKNNNILKNIKSTNNNKNTNIKSTHNNSHNSNNSNNSNNHSNTPNSYSDDGEVSSSSSYTPNSNNEINENSDKITLTNNFDNDYNFEKKEKNRRKTLPYITNSKIKKPNNFKLKNITNIPNNNNIINKDNETIVDNINNETIINILNKDNEPLNNEQLNNQTKMTIINE